MSFSLSQIQRKCNNRKVTNINKIKQCYKYVNSLDILTDNVKYGLTKYLDYRFKQRKTNDLQYTLLQDMIKELLENCCQLPYIKIGINQCKLNECEILYQIKKAIYFGATKHIYSIYANMENTQILDSMSFRKDILPPQRIKETNIEIQTVKNYFSDLEII